jgi:uncharacterized protein YdeI (YjbR/CyaY-like superfamily)
MSKPVAKTFTALLEADGTQLRWVIARIPFDFAKVWPERNGRRVRGDIEGFPYRTSLFPDPHGEGQILLVNKKMQAGAQARVGSKVRIRMEPDMEERPTLIPSELAAILKGDRGLRKWFDALSPSMCREIGKWVDDAKGADVRQKRAEKIAERMLLAMEGEQEPPPILRRIFQREPKAEAGWNLLTPTQRRNQLLGIFYYETVEARERRARKAIELALQAVEKGVKKKPGAKKSGAER